MDISMRVPRATNLSELINLVMIIKDSQTIDELFSKTKFQKKIQFLEYIKLLNLLRWIEKRGSHIILSEQGIQIKNLLILQKFQNIDEFSILKKDFLNLKIIKIFLEKVYSCESVEKNTISDVCLNKEEIIQRYQKYRDVKESVLKRETRIIYNWLVELKILEVITNKDIKNNSKVVSYHLIGKIITPAEFSTLIKPFYFKMMKNFQKQHELSTLIWIDYPTLRNNFCIKYNISKEQFDVLLKDYTNKNPNSFQLASGQYLRNEVKTDGIEIDNRWIYYVRLAEGDDDE